MGWITGTPVKKQGEIPLEGQSVAALRTTIYLIDTGDKKYGKF